MCDCEKLVATAIFIYALGYYCGNGFSFSSELPTDLLSKFIYGVNAENANIIML